MYNVFAGYAIPGTWRDVSAAFNALKEEGYPVSRSVAVLTKPAAELSLGRESL
jgi:hypothetical protein